MGFVNLMFASLIRNGMFILHLLMLLCLFSLADDAPAYMIIKLMFGCAILE